MSETVRDMLDRLEKEVSEKIEALRRDIAPFERELADIRRAKGALGQSVTLTPGSATLRHTTTSPTVTSGPPPQSPYKRLTMKELVLKALNEQYPEGATANQLMEFFAHAWGRNDILRSSLSPQLSRLKSEGKIDRRGLVWRLIDKPETVEAPSEQNPEGAPNPTNDGSGHPLLIESREAADTSLVD